MVGVRESPVITLEPRPVIARRVTEWRIRARSPVSSQ
jgi:hypothetical protein